MYIEYIFASVHKYRDEISNNISKLHISIKYPKIAVITTYICM